MVTRVRWPVVAWAGLTAYVCAVDLALIRGRHDTLSTAFRDAVRHPIKRWPVGVLWTFITAHLFLDLRWDPLRMAGERLSRHADDASPRTRLRVEAAAQAGQPSLHT